MSSPSVMISPRLMPMRNRSRRSVGTVRFRSASASWISMALCTPSVTLENSISSPSPVVLTRRPRCSAILGSMSSLRMDLSCASVPASSASMRREKPTTSAATITASRRESTSLVIPHPWVRPWCHKRRKDACLEFSQLTKDLPKACIFERAISQVIAALLPKDADAITKDVGAMLWHNAGSSIGHAPRLKARKRPRAGKPEPTRSHQI